MRVALVLTCFVYVASNMATDASLDFLKVFCSFCLLLAFVQDINELCKGAEK